MFDRQQDWGHRELGGDAGVLLLVPAPVMAFYCQTRSPPAAACCAAVSGCTVALSNNGLAWSSCIRINIETGVDADQHLCFLVTLLLPSQDQFDSIDLSDNAIVRLEGFPRLPRLKVLLLNNNRIAKIARSLEGRLTGGA